MEPAVLTTISALAGASIGAMSTPGTTWMTTKSQARAARITAERARREDLYGHYMDELARLYASALNRTEVDYERLTLAYLHATGFIGPGARVTLIGTAASTREPAPALSPLEPTPEA